MKTNTPDTVCVLVSQVKLKPGEISSLQPGLDLAGVSSSPPCIWTIGKAGIYNVKSNSLFTRLNTA